MSVLTDIRYFGDILGDKSYIMFLDLALALVVRLKFLLKASSLIEYSYIKLILIFNWIDEVHDT